MYQEFRLESPSSNAVQDRYQVWWTSASGEVKDVYGQTLEEKNDKKHT